MSKKNKPVYPFTRTAILRDTKFTTRAEETGERIIEGYFAVFDDVYPMWEGAVERIDPHAFDNTLGRDIRALTNHDDTLVLGRTTPGTLTLRIDDHGLWGRIVINENDQDAVNTYARVDRGDVTQCSFGFDAVKEEKVKHDDGTVEYILREVVLYEVSVVTFPAYESTEVEARKKDFEREKLEKWRADAIEKLRRLRKC